MIDNIWVLLAIAGILAIIVWMINSNGSISQGVKNASGIIAILIVVVLLIMWFYGHPLHR